MDILHNRMQEAGVRNMSVYIRKMALNGYVIVPKWPDPILYSYGKNKTVVHGAI